MPIITIPNGDMYYVRKGTYKTDFSCPINISFYMPKRLRNKRIRVKIEVV